MHPKPTDIFDELAKEAHDGGHASAFATLYQARREPLEKKRAGLKDLFSNKGV